MQSHFPTPSSKRTNHYQREWKTCFLGHQLYHTQWSPPLRIMGTKEEKWRRNNNTCCLSPISRTMLNRSWYPDQLYLWGPLLSTRPHQQSTMTPSTPTLLRTWRSLFNTSGSETLFSALIVPSCSNRQLWLILHSLICYNAELHRVRPMLGVVHRDATNVSAFAVVLSK